MKNKDIKDELYNIFDNLIYSSFNNVADKVKNNKGVVLNMKKESNKKLFYGLGLGFACVIMLFMGLIFFRNNSDIAVIGIDVNPSLELSINSKNKVVSVNTNNDDAIKVIGDMNLKGTDVLVAMNAIFGSMVKNGYINDNENSILISLVHGEYNVNKLANDVYSQLQNEKVNSSILTLNTNTNDYDNELSKKYNISVSKVKLIKSIINKNSLYKFEDLCKLSTNDLNILANSSINKNDEVSTIGSASTSKYISIDNVKDIVFKHAKVENKNVTNLEIEYDYENGNMIYDVEFHCNNIEYDYEVDAVSGKILKIEIENNNNNNNSNNKYLSKNKIEEIAIKKANVSKYYDYDIEFEFKGGTPIYEVEFETDGAEYEIEIDAKNGNIIKYEVKNKKVDTSKLISKDKAKNIVLNDAKVSEYYDYEIELDDNEYEINFETREYEYKYKLDAKTGKILEKDTDKND
ncbi:MAG: PepSY domain-containing protein [Tenericutes bacterium]|nr:PepSY domain-containing protein [Mycoplasmatota bacterium]